MQTCPTTRIKNKFGTGYAIKNTADLTDDDELFVESDSDESGDGFEKLTVAVLKEKLADAGLETGGKKQELVDRLRG